MLNWIPLQLQDEKKNSLCVIGIHKSGSLIAIWQLNNTLNILENPIVWIDSEGSPLCVIAINYLEFLSILPYGVGLFYDVISSWDWIKLNNERYNEFSEKFNLSYCESLLTQNKLIYYETFIKIELILKKNKMNIEKNPFSKIIKAIENNADFEAWLLS